MSVKAVFLDRDGVVNEMIYNTEHGYVDSPSKPSQFKLINGVKKAIKILKKLDYKVIIISNQPGVAKGYFSNKTFENIQKKMHLELAKSKITLDDEFYCLHHPNAKIKTYKKKCSCRKPGISLITKAKKIHNLNLKSSFFIGDGIVDMVAAKKAGCKSIFIGNVNSTTNKMFNEKKCVPEHIFHSLLEAAEYLKTTHN